MANSPKPPFHTYFFIESHPASLAQNLEIQLDTKHKAVQPLIKIIEKEFKLADGQQDFIISIYSGEIMGSLLKQKEIMMNQNKTRVFPIKIALKLDKNKFDLKLYPYIDYDCFMPFVKFEPIKKLIGKAIEPPPQIGLTPFNYISLFSEALIINLKKQADDPTMLAFLHFCVSILESLQKIPFKLFLLIYQKILYSKNVGLTCSILKLYNISKIESPKTVEEIVIYKDSLMAAFKDQNQILDRIKKSQQNTFFSNMTKFYNIIILYFYFMNDIKSIEEIMIDLRDNNSFDKLVLPKMILEDNNNIYKNIQISKELKLSLMDKYLQVSESHANIITSFSLISEYVDGDINTILSLIVKYYGKIHKYFLQNHDSLKLNEYIKPRMTDNLEKVQESLSHLGKKKLHFQYKAIYIKNETWNIYINAGNNPTFFEFLASHLIQASLTFYDIDEALDYITKFTNKNMVTMMKLFLNNYQKLQDICQKEKKQINASSFLEPSLDDDPDAIKENLDAIISRQLKSNFETIYFPISIWLFYVNNGFNTEFLFYIESKLLQLASVFDEIIDCLTYASTLRNKQIVGLLKFIIENFEKINYFAKQGNRNIDFTEFYQINEENDDIDEIYGLICQLINLEINAKHKTFDFPLKMWKPYSESQDLEYLRIVRNIIQKLKEMDSSLDEDFLELPKKIHNVGYKYIGEGKLVGDQLVEFLSKEEDYYNEKLIKNIMYAYNDQQKQLNTNLNNIKSLENDYNALTRRADLCEKEIKALKAESSNIVAKSNNLENDVNNLIRKVTTCEGDINSLRRRFNK